MNAYRYFTLVLIVNAVVAGAAGVDGAANEFGAGVVGAGNVADNPIAVKEGAFFGHGGFFDVNDGFVEVVAT